MMKTRAQIHPRHLQAMTMVEFVICLAIISFLIILNLPLSRTPTARAPRITCANNLKNVGLAFTIYSMDHSGGLFPFHSSTNGTGHLTNTHDAYRHFQILSNELHLPRLLICPADPGRTVAKSFVTLSNSNLSYFVGLSADETHPESLLSGDRNLSIHGTPPRPGLRTLKPSYPLSWTAAQHNSHGIIGFADGSVRQMSSDQLQNYHQKFTNITNVILVP